MKVHVIQRVQLSCDEELWQCSELPWTSCVLRLVGSPALSYGFPLLGSCAGDREVNGRNDTMSLADGMYTYIFYRRVLHPCG